MSRELGKLHGTGLYKISLTGYSAALAVIEGHNVLHCPAIPAGLQISIAARRSTSLSGDASGGKTRVERRSWTHLRLHEEKHENGSLAVL